MTRAAVFAGVLLALVATGVANARGDGYRAPRAPKPPHIKSIRPPRPPHIKAIRPPKAPRIKPIKPIRAPRLPRLGHSDRVKD